ncbi:glucose-1-phosphate thymidylyltransferase, partial [Candidatus Woesearchaeota archaeon]|nr:glucose-1-phosphate thymidylyltransferase [Candidatus Woesearchaeota archaeon]
FPTQHLKKVLAHNSDGVMSACIVDREKAKQLGVFLVEDGRIAKIIEKSPEPPSTLANAYIHYMPKEAFEAIRQSTTPGVGGEYRFVDAVQIMINNGKKITYEPLTDWIDIGTEEQLQKAQELAKDL